MADGFRFRLAVRRGSCADLVSRLADGAEGDEEGQIVRIDYAPGGWLLPRWSNLETENIGVHGGKHAANADSAIEPSVVPMISERLGYDFADSAIYAARLARLMAPHGIH